MPPTIGTNVARVQFPHLAPYVDWVCWFRLNSALRGFPQSTPVFPSHQKPTFHMIWFVNDFKIVIWTMLFSCRIVKRISSYIHANLRYRNWTLFSLSYNNKSTRQRSKGNVCFITIDVRLGVVIIMINNIFIAHNSNKLSVALDGNWKWI